MSGFEVVGVALAVFPIVVKGISQFAEGAHTIKYWRRYRIQLEDYAALIESNWTTYLNTLEELLGDIITSNDEYNLLLSDPQGPAWREPKLDMQLRQRLDRSYDVYIKMVKRMRDGLDKLRERLGISASGEVLWNSYSIFRRETKKIKLALLEDVNKGLIEDIEKANLEIHRIVHRNVSLEPQRKKRKSRRPTADLKLIRKHAASLHRVLITDKVWKCQCKRLHVASLRLEPRPQLQDNVTSDFDTKYSFRILVSTSHGTQTPLMTHGWREIEARPSLSRSAACSPEQSIHRPGKGVRFISDPSPIPTSKHLPPENDVLIADICAALCQASTMRQCMGFLLDERDQEHKHHLYLAEMTSSHEPRSKSLGDLLASPPSNSTAGALFRKERLEIAITLASSVLQLDGTQWLKPQWTSNDIYFHEGTSQESALCYRYPYLPWKHCTMDSDLSVNKETLKLRTPFIRSKVLFALGLTLTELCFGKTLKNMQEPEDVDTSEVATNMNCAFRLLESRSIWRNMGEVYEAVVRRCLNQTFDVQDMSFDNEDLQQQVYETVVMPLTDELDDFLGKSKIR